MSVINYDLDASNSASDVRFPKGGAAKRAFDITVASILLFCALPAMFFIVVIMISSDRGPVLFSHERIGHKGRRFRCLKFRSMVTNSQEALTRHLEMFPQAQAEWDANQKLRDDPRITRLGAFLRATSLDELPQLINVIRGEMSLVGPRPIVQAEVIRYANDIASYVSTRPGITGLWQVSGRSDVDYDRRVQLDAQYVREWSFLGDVMIMVRTIKVVLLRTGSR